jgi:inner membrane protein
LDNVTHTVFGLLVAEAALSLRGRGGERPPPGLRGLSLFVSAAANNFPDLDFAYAGITGGKLGYLLHHRGHTHTLIAALPSAAFVYALAWIWSRTRKLVLAKRDHGFLLGLALFGVAAHIGLDATNVYGVHPFWPFDSRWYFGDAVFIVEPLLLAVALPALFFATGSRLLRGLALLPLVGSLLLAAGLDFVPWFALATFVALVLASFFGLPRLTAERRAPVALACWVLVTAGFFAARFPVERATAAGVARALPGSRLLEVAVTPLPANPFCFLALGLAIDQGDYVALLGTAAPLGVSVTRCPKSPPGTARLEAAPQIAGDELAWHTIFRAPATELGKLAATDCRVSAILRFLRAPYWQRDPRGALTIGDLRFDREAELGFAELELRGPLSCPEHVPDWTPPREDLLRRADGHH